jgi:hypothetical protein
METKFTPGPWVLGGCSGRMITTPNGYVGDGFIGDADTLANAKLMVASPELYQALVGLNQAIDAYWNADSRTDALVKEITRWQQISLAALNKAT